MEIKQAQEEFLKDTMAAAIAYYIRKESVLEMVRAKIAEIPELESLDAELLADAFNCMEVDVGTLMSIHMKS
jgi:hypothetical protein